MWIFFSAKYLFDSSGFFKMTHFIFSAVFHCQLWPHTVKEIVEASNQHHRLNDGNEPVSSFEELFSTRFCTFCSLPLCTFCSLYCILSWIIIMLLQCDYSAWFHMSIIRLFLLPNLVRYSEARETVITNRTGMLIRLSHFTRFKYTFVALGIKWKNSVFCFVQMKVYQFLSAAP